jgi:hypothetical protein
MYPIHDTDAQLLLATLIAAKRRPAPLVEIVAAAEFMGCPVTAPKAWGTAFERLSTHGLLVVEGEGFALTPAAQAMATGLPKKAETDERVFLVREKLSVHKPAVKSAAVVITTEQFEVALKAHGALAQQGGKNLLMPKPKREEDNRPRGPQARRPFGNPRRYS